MKEITLTRGERFKDARTVYNQHGHQTMAQVHKATGVSASLIQELEDDSNRDFGYCKIVKLAEHYGVSIDWLLGLSPTKSPDPSLQAAVEYTQIPEDAIQAFRSCAAMHYALSSEPPEAQIKKDMKDGAASVIEEPSEPFLEEIFNDVAHQFASIFDMIVELMRYSAPGSLHWYYLRDMAKAHFNFVSLQKECTNVSEWYGDPQKRELDYALFRCQQSYIDYCKQLAKDE